MICPKCRKEIRYLLCYAEEENIYFVEKQGGKLHYELISSSHSGLDGAFRCPECEELLFTSNREARAFLEGE